MDSRILLVQSDITILFFYIYSQNTVSQERPSKYSGSLLMVTTPSRSLLPKDSTQRKWGCTPSRLSTCFAVTCFFRGKTSGNRHSDWFKLVGNEEAPRHILLGEHGSRFTRASVSTPWHCPQSKKVKSVIGDVVDETRLDRQIEGRVSYPSFHK